MAHRGTHGLYTVCRRVLWQGRARYWYLLSTAPCHALWARAVPAASLHSPRCSWQKASRGGGFLSDTQGSISGMVQQMCSSEWGDLQTVDLVVCRAGWVVSTSLAPIGSPTSCAVLSVHICWMLLLQTGKVRDSCSWCSSENIGVGHF